MCGIVYSKNFNGLDVTSTVLKRFEAQRSRGTTSFGFYLPIQNQLTHNVKEARIKALLKRSKGDNTEILFHHRFATSTIDTRSACHPFSTKSHFESNYVGVHNGVLHNEDDLKAEHTKLGIDYVSLQPNGSYNDSEALVYDLARYFEGQVDSISAVGSVAFIVVKNDTAGKPTTLFFGRNSGNPLKMKKTANSLTVSSEGEGLLIEPNTLYMFDYDTRTLRTAPMAIATYNYSKYSGPAYTGTTFGNDGYSSYDGRQYDSWDHYMDERYPDRKATKILPYNDGDNDSIIDEILRQEWSDRADGDRAVLSAGFDMRTGSKWAIKNAFIVENPGKIQAAMLQAELESEDAMVEGQKLDKMIVKEMSDEAIDALFDYSAELADYEAMLREIADELYTEAKAQGVVKDDPFGFHAKGELVSPQSNILTLNA